MASNCVQNHNSEGESDENGTSEERPDRNPFVCGGYTDLVLKVDGSEIHVARGVLCSNSPVFKTMLTQSFKEQNANEISLEDDIYDEMCALMDAIHPPLRPNVVAGNRPSFLNKGTVQS